MYKMEITKQFGMEDFSMHKFTIKKNAMMLTDLCKTELCAIGVALLGASFWKYPTANYFFAEIRSRHTEKEITNSDNAHKKCDGLRDIIDSMQSIKSEIIIFICPKCAYFFTRTTSDGYYMKKYIF